MGMRENIRNLEEAEQASFKLKQQKEIERKKRQEQKEDKKRLEYDAKRFLRKEFEKYIFTIGSCCTSEFYSIERKKKIFEDLKSNVLLQKKQVLNGVTLSYYNDKDVMFLQEFYNKYYYKILKEVEKEKILDEQYSFWHECEKIEIEEAKKEIDFINISKIILAVLFFPITFLLIIIFAVIKNTK